MKSDKEVKELLAAWLTKDKPSMAGIPPSVPINKERKAPVSLSRHMNYAKTRTWLSKMQSEISQRDIKEADIAYEHIQTGIHFADMRTMHTIHHFFLDDSLGSRKEALIKYAETEPPGWLESRYPTACCNPLAGWLLSAPYFDMCMIFNKMRFLVLAVPKEHASGLIELSSRNIKEHRSASGSFMKNLVYLG